MSSKEAAALGVKDEVAGATEDGGDFSVGFVSFVALLSDEIGGSTPLSAAAADAGGVGGVELRL